jgi:hypothetical protein
MEHTVSPIFFAVGLVLRMLLFEVGRRLRIKEPRTPHENELGLGAVEGATFALFGLLLAEVPGQEVPRCHRVRR